MGPAGPGPGRPVTAPTTALVLAEDGGASAPLAVAAVPVAEGGDATIHAVEGRPEWVAKLYRDPASEPRRRAKLDAMLAAPPAGRVAEHDGRRTVQLAWPVSLVEREGAEGEGPPAGFVMPRVHLEEAVVLEQLLSGRARRAAGLPDGVRLRVAAARNLSAVVAALHAEGHHVVDLKPSNVHVYRGTFFVAVLDCDGFSVAGPDGERFPAHQYTDGYIAPEALRARAKPEALGEAQDRFALAVVVFRLLNRGLHPFQGVPQAGASVPTTDGERVAAGLYPYGSGADRLSPPPASLYGALDRPTRRLFDRAFDGPEGGRPAAAEWARHLSTLLGPDGLRPCPNDPDHAVYPGAADCGVCAQGARPTPRPPDPPAPSAAAAAHPRTGLMSTKSGYVGTLVVLSVAWFALFQFLFSDDAARTDGESYDYYDESAPPLPPLEPEPFDGLDPLATPPPPPAPPPAPPPYQSGSLTRPEPVGGLDAVQRRVSYSEVAREAGLEGTVTVAFTVRTDGSPVLVEAIDASFRSTRQGAASSPVLRFLLESRAENAVRQSEFEPGRVRGEPVEMQTTLSLKFELDAEADGLPDAL